MREFSRASTQLEVIARNSDWYIVQFAPVLIGRSHYFRSGEKLTL